MVDAASDYDLLGPNECESSLNRSSREVSQEMSPDERASFVESIVLHTEVFERAVSAIETLISRQGALAVPGGLRICGPGGVGKSFILKTILSRYPRHDDGLSIDCPVVEISFGRSPTPASFAAEIMRRLGDSFGIGSSRSEYHLEMLTDAFAQCSTRLLVIDEAHELVPSSGPRRNQDRLAGATGDFIKALYDRSGVPIVWSGLSTLNLLFESDAQLSSRWPGRIDIRDYANDQLWRTTLDVFDEALPMDSTGGLACEELADQLYEATAGNMRRLKIVLTECVRIASRMGHPAIGREHVRQARESLCM